MPRGNGTGPAGTGRGSGLGNQSGTGRGRMGGPFSAGPQGYCICPECGTEAPHGRGEACNTIKCPKCGAMMTRK
ncbi:hypothetical protein [Gudongella sp. DL1XJH-153]|uniref:hypothetical protein n=1 Tax=Gudongella sp. DL1XJH-153 TaxID=3409804 RepID=UPI003BB5E0F4